ncbi:hypothetical protein ACFE04_007477 [Oxalis oulophora]
MDLPTSRRLPETTERSVFARLGGQQSTTRRINFRYFNGNQLYQKRKSSPYQKPFKKSWVRALENLPVNIPSYKSGPRNSFAPKGQLMVRQVPKRSTSNVSPAVKFDNKPMKKAFVWTRGVVRSAQSISKSIAEPCATDIVKKDVLSEAGNLQDKTASGLEVVSPHGEKNGLCKFWLSGNCKKDEKCQFLHSWSLGDGFSMLTKLEGHEKAITGIVLPVGSDKIYTGSVDGTTRIWDCNTGQCSSVSCHGDKVGSLISEGPWIFIGMPNTVKALNLQTSAEYSLKGPVGQVSAMIVANDMLFAGAQDGAISVWTAGPLEDPFNLSASLKGHTSAVLCLTVRGKMLYSGSLDHTIKVWDLNTLTCVATLTGHTGGVMSLLYWSDYLLSCSLDKTIKVWSVKEDGNWEVAYTHTEEHGLLALGGMTDAEAKSILFCSSNDNSVHLYDLPSFVKKGRLFSRQEVRDIQAGPFGLFFTGDATGTVTVWKGSGWVGPRL